MQQKKLQFNLSYFLGKCREYSNLQPKATFWFGAVLSLVDENHHKQLCDDTAVAEKTEIIRIMSTTLAAVAAFYDQERPPAVFKLLNFVAALFEREGECHEYSFLVAKVNYLNALALYALKTHQYSHALDTYGQILELYNQKVIDNASESFLVALSNYLSLLRNSGKHLTSRLLELETTLKDCFFDCLAKLMLSESGATELYLNCVTLLAGVYRQHCGLLARFQKDVDSLAAHAFQGQLRAKKKLPEDVGGWVVAEKIRRQACLRLAVSQDELKFYCSSKAKARPRPTSRGNPQDAEKHRLTKIEALLSQSIQMLNEQKLSSLRFSTLQLSPQPTSIRDLPSIHDLPSIRDLPSIHDLPRYETLRPTRPFQHPRPTLETLISDNKLTLQPVSPGEKKASFQPLGEKQALQPLKKARFEALGQRRAGNQGQSKGGMQGAGRSLTRRKQLPGKACLVKQQKASRQTKIKFKIFSTFIQVNEDGMLLSDYTNENKRYIEWNTLSLIIERIEVHFPFQDFLKVPIENYYDFVRIISFYLRKNDSRELCLLSKPLPLLQLNELVKLYKQDGKFLKLALMNQYDTGKFVGVLDLYITEYSQFFKTLTQNEYLCCLNERISSRPTETRFSPDNTYRLDYLKRKRQTTVTELCNQLHADSLEMAIEDRGCLYKCVYLLKNNLQLIVRLIDSIKPNTNPEEFVLEAKISNLDFYGSSSLFIESDYEPVKGTEKITKTVEIPMHRLTSLFPLYNAPLRDYFESYGRMIVDCLNNFEHFSKQKNLGGLTFEFTTHVQRTEMIEYGKYFSVVSAELVGSAERIWALVVKFYDLAYMKESVSVLMNPYNDFLQHVVRAGRQEQSQVLRNLLINESVKETVLWLKKTGKIETRFNIFEYLYANNLI